MLRDNQNMVYVITLKAFFASQNTEKNSAYNTRKTSAFLMTTVQ